MTLIPARLKRRSETIFVKISDKDGATYIGLKKWHDDGTRYSTATV